MYQCHPMLYKNGRPCAAFPLIRGRPETLQQTDAF
jgi:hypothetical protein